MTDLGKCRPSVAGTSGFSVQMTFGFSCEIS